MSPEFQSTLVEVLQLSAITLRRRVFFSNHLIVKADHVSYYYVSGVKTLFVISNIDSKRLQLRVRMEIRPGIDLGGRLSVAAGFPQNPLSFHHTHSIFDLFVWAIESNSRNL